jgi:two-component system, NtrC family, response regulator
MTRAPRRQSTQTLERSAQSGSSVVLVVAPDTPAERRVPLGDKTLTIGSGAGVDILIADPHVSRRHAEVKRVAEGVLLRDVGSRNGTYVEGMAVKEIILKDGALLSVGLTRIMCLLQGAAAARAASPPPPIAAPPPPPLDEGATRFGDAVGSSAQMRKVFGLLEKLAPTELTITLLGETGTGKDVLARGVHDKSARHDGPFVIFDCGAAAPSLIESELFGHERGAFTGAGRERQGAFERADGGTLFLDEVGELALELQPKLLRALDQARVRRVGGAEDRPVDVRVIAATNRNIEEDVRQGRFREDLFFRLSAAIVAVPPLREHLDDLPELASAVLEAEHPGLAISQDVLSVLSRYDWPGNVRELRNVLLGAAAMAEANTLLPRDLIFFRPRRRDPTIDKLPLAGRSLESIEKAAIEQTLRQCDGNKARAARTLGIAASTLYEKLKKYGQ